jgi:hypothetical protein
MHGRLTRTVAGAARDGNDSEIGGRGDDRRGDGDRKRLKVGQEGSNEVHDRKIVGGELLVEERQINSGSVTEIKAALDAGV